MRTLIGALRYLITNQRQPICDCTRCSYRARGAWSVLGHMKAAHP